MQHHGTGDAGGPGLAGASSGDIGASGSGGPVWADGELLRDDTSAVQVGCRRSAVCFLRTANSHLRH